MRQFAAHPQGFGHDHQVRQGLCAQLSHDSTAVDFGRELADFQSTGDLLVHEPVAHQSHDLLFPGGQSQLFGAEVPGILFIFASLSITLESARHGVQ